MEILPIQFSGLNKYGDFNWMINQKEYDSILFIFNDNTECHFSSKNGAGNAVIRQYNKYNTKINRPRSAGIPTGTLRNGGFLIFDDKTKKIIDDSFDEIIEIIKKYDYKRIAFSAEKNSKLGTSIFRVNKEIIDYITNRIYTI